MQIEEQLELFKRYLYATNEQDSLSNDWISYSEKMGINPIKTRYWFITSVVSNVFFSYLRKTHNICELREQGQLFDKYLYKEQNKKDILQIIKNDYDSIISKNIKIENTAFYLSLKIENIFLEYLLHEKYNDNDNDNDKMKSDNNNDEE